MTECAMRYLEESTENDPRQIDVDISDWAQGTNDAVLYTAGLDTCIGIAVADPHAQVGHLGHFADPLVEEVMIDEMLTLAVQDIDDPGKLSVWVRGGAYPVVKDGTPRTKLAQDLVLRHIGAFGLLVPDVKWGSDTGICFDMRLDCATGTCAIDEIEW